MKDADASSTAKVIAASTLLLESDPASAHLVAPGAAAWCGKFLTLTWTDRLLARSAVNPFTRALWRWMEACTHPGIMRHYWYRKRWIEARCRAAIADGCERVIVLGAGFDTLGCRLASAMAQVEWIEADHPATQRAKRAALEAVPIRFIELDLEHEALPEELARDPKRTLVVAEGVLMYLSPASIDRFFASLRRMSAARLRVIFSFMTRWPDGTSGFRPRSWLIERWLGWRGEPFTWAIAPADLPAFLATRGFAIEELALTRLLSSGATALDGENLVLCERSLRDAQP